MSSPVQTPKARNDFTILQTWLNISRYLAYAPLNVQTSPSKKGQSLLIKSYPFILFLFYFGATMFSFYERHFIYKGFNISQSILDTLQGLTEWIFIEYIVLSSLRRNRWRKLMRSVKQFEPKVNLNVEGPIEDCSIKGLMIQIFLCHLVYVAAHLYDTICNWTKATYSLAFVIYRFTTYYIMFSTLLMAILCTWLKNRYLLLEHFLKDSVVRRNFKFVVFDKEPGCVYYDKLKEFSLNYKRLYLIVHEFNDIFGWQMFLISICTVLEILNAVNYGMPATPMGHVIDNDIFVNTLFSILYVICNTRIVMACDAVEKCGEKVRNTCLLLYENAEKYELKEELCRLENYVRGLSPRISAAGFWRVNQAVLSTLFSSVMTYLIIIIQFNITLQ